MLRAAAPVTVQPLAGLQAATGQTQFVAAPFERERSAPAKSTFTCDALPAQTPGASASSAVIASAVPR